MSYISIMTFVLLSLAGLSRGGTVPFDESNGYVHGDAVVNGALNSDSAFSFAKNGQNTGEVRRIVVPADTSGSRVSICLNGAWKFQLGDDKMDLPATNTGRWIDLPVPSLFTSTDPDSIEFPEVPPEWRSVGEKRIGWYSRNIFIPSSFDGKQLGLNLGQVAFAADVLVNGVWCGVSIGSQNPAVIDVSSAVKPGCENQIMIAVRNADFFLLGYAEPDDPKRFPGIGQGKVVVEQQGEVRIKKTRRVDWFPNPYFRVPYMGLGQVAGISGDIILEVQSPLAEIIRQKLETQVSGGKILRTKTWIRSHAATPQVVEISRRILDSEGHTALALPTRKVMVQPGELFVSRDFRRWDDVKLWGIGGKYGSPYLYTLNTRIMIDGNVIDTDSVRFGFRELAAGNPSYTDDAGKPQDPLKLYLNNQEIFLQGDCIGWVGKGINSYNRPFLRDFFAVYQQLGVNYIRPHTHQLMPQLFFDVADEMGMMIASQYPLHQHSSPFLDWQVPADAEPAWAGHYDHLYRDIKNWVEAGWNHPSIVAWVPENEVISHIRNMPDRAEALNELDTYIKTVDSSRLVYDEGSRNMNLAGSSADIAGIHYPFGRTVNEAGTFVGSEKTWQEAFGKPVYVGEDVAWKEFLRNLEIRGEKYSDIQEEERDLVALGKEFQRRQALSEKLGFSGYSYWNISTFAFGGGYARGPWDIEFPTYSQLEKISWPAMSGYGARARVAEFGLKRNFAKINWFDPSKPLFTPSVFYGYVKQVWANTPYAPKVDGKLQLSPEVIIDTGVSGSWVTAVPEQNASDPSVLVLQSDADGKAWFTLPESGTYTFLWEDNGMVMKTSKEFDWGRQVPLVAGYGYIPVVEMVDTQNKN